MDPSAAEITSIIDMGALMDWIGIEDVGERKTRSSCLGALGGPRLIRQLVAIPLHVYEKAMADLEIVVKDVTEFPSPLEIGQLGELRRVARVVMGLAPETSLAPSPSGAGPGPGFSAAAPASSSAVTFEEMTKALKEAVRPSSKRILASQVVDQCDSTEVVPLDRKVLQALTDDWKALCNDGEEPSEEEEATSEQLAALNAKILAGETPYVDFGIWRPYGARLGRAMKFVAHIQQADGTTLPKEISGPSDIMWWKRCWKAYAYAMTVLKYATSTRLQRYAEKVIGLAEEYPAYWWIIAMADIKMRSEGLERIRRDCVRRTAAMTLTDYDPLRPWDVVFREAALSDFWGKEVDKPINHICNGLKSAASVKDAGFGPIIEVSADGQAKGSRTPARDTQEGQEKPSKRPRAARKQLPPAKGKGGGQEQKGSPSLPKPPGPILNLVNIDMAERKTPDGKHLRDKTGRQLCWDYNRKTCNTPCKMERAHCCEWCREEHPSHKCGKRR